MSQIKVKTGSIMFSHMKDNNKIPITNIMKPTHPPSSFDEMGIGAGMGSGLGFGLGFGGLMFIVAPHSWQNWASLGFFARHLGQSRSFGLGCSCKSFSPHSAQKTASSGLEWCLLQYFIIND